MEFAVYATWDHDASVPEEVFGRIDRALPKEGNPCLTMDEPGQRHVTLGLDIEAPNYQEAIEIGRAALDRIIGLGPLTGRPTRIVATTDEGQLVWDAPQGATESDQP